MTLNRDSLILHWLLRLYLISIPFFGFSLLNIDGRGLGRIDWLIGGLMVLVFGLAALGGRLPIISNPPAVLIAVYVCSGILSGINILGTTESAHVIDFATKGLQLLIVTPIFFIVSSLALNRVQMRSVLRLWGMIALIIATHAIYQVLAQVFDLPFAEFALNNPTIGRVNTRIIFGFAQPVSIFREPGFMVAFLAPAFVLVGSYVLSGHAHLVFFRRNWRNWLMVATIGIAIVISGALAGLVTVIGTFIYMLLRGTVRRRQIVRLLLVTIFGLLTVALILNAIGIEFLSALMLRIQFLFINIFDPNETAEITSAADRFRGLEVGFDAWRQRPLLGIGLGNLEHVSAIRATVNNPWVQVLVEQGTIGFFSLLSACILLVVQLERLARTLPADDFWQPACVAMAAVMVVTMLGALFAYVWTHPYRVFTLAIANLVVVQAMQAAYRRVR